MVVGGHELFVGFGAFAAHGGLGCVWGAGYEVSCVYKRYAVKLAEMDEIVDIFGFVGTVKMLECCNVFRLGLSQKKTPA